MGEAGCEGGCGKAITKFKENKKQEKEELECSIDMEIY